MNQSAAAHAKFFLGIDGGQSHTEAVVADERGNILGRGFGGALEHAELPGGGERLANAVQTSVGAALEKADLPALSAIVFTSAHCGMTGGAIYKEKIVRTILNAENLVVGNDATTALCGATAGSGGIVVIAGTGSIVLGENEGGETARIGGLGYLFSDEGGGFWLASQIIRLAVKEQDDLIEPCGLQSLVLEFFGKNRIREITDDFYNGKISRDQIAKLAEAAACAAENGNEIIRGQIEYGAGVLAASVASAARRLNFASTFPVAGVGGMFRARLMNEFFKESLAANVPHAEFIKPRFGPAIGALLLAYRRAKVEITGDLLNNLSRETGD